jgi:uncharacterized repeat protein (TIGR02543 family)
MKIKRRFLAALFGSVLCALAFAGCKDMFHSAADAEDTRITITYNANGGTGTAPAAQTVTGGASVTLASGSGLTRSGYTFGGWNANSAGTGASYSAGTSYSFTANTTLYAKWTNTGTQVTITYSANGGTGTAPAAQTVTGGASVTLASGSGLTRSGYTFGGWNANSAGTGAS